MLSRASWFVCRAHSLIDLICLFADDSRVVVARVIGRCKNVGAVCSRHTRAGHRCGQVSSAERVRYRPERPSKLVRIVSAASEKEITACTHQAQRRGDYYRRCQDHLVSSGISQSLDIAERAHTQDWYCHHLSRIVLTPQLRFRQNSSSAPAPLVTTSINQWPIRGRGSLVRACNRQECDMLHRRAHDMT